VTKFGTACFSKWKVISEVTFECGWQLSPVRKPSRFPFVPQFRQFAFLLLWKSSIDGGSLNVSPFRRGNLSVLRCFRVLETRDFRLSLIIVNFPPSILEQLSDSGFAPCGLRESSIREGNCGFKVTEDFLVDSEGTSTKCTSIK
jgi:hypothetical protein